MRKGFSKTAHGWQVQALEFIGRRSAIQLLLELADNAPGFQLGNHELGRRLKLSDRSIKKNLELLQGLGLIVRQGKLTPQGYKRNLHITPECRRWMREGILPHIFSDEAIKSCEQPIQKKFPEEPKFPCRDSLEKEGIGDKKPIQEKFPEEPKFPHKKNINLKKEDYIREDVHNFSLIDSALQIAAEIKTLAIEIISMENSIGEFSVSCEELKMNNDSNDYVTPCYAPEADHHEEDVALYLFRRLVKCIAANHEEYAPPVGQVKGYQINRFRQLVAEHGEHRVAAAISHIACNEYWKTHCTGVPIFVNRFQTIVTSMNHEARRDIMEDNRYNAKTARELWRLETMKIDMGRVVDSSTGAAVSLYQDHDDFDAEFRRVFAPHLPDYLHTVPLRCSFQANGMHFAVR